MLLYQLSSVRSFRQQPTPQQRHKRRSAMTFKSDSTSQRRAASDHAALVNDHMSWSRSGEELLKGLLSIQIDEPFTDLDHLCPQRAWLVVHLDLVAPLSSIHHVLDALAGLIVRSEQLRLHEMQHGAFWRRVLTSEMMRDAASANAPSVTKFQRFVQSHGVFVLLSWRGKPFQCSVAAQLRTFLDAPLAKYNEALDDALDVSVDLRGWLPWRPVGVGIQFAECTMTTDDFYAAGDLLSGSSAAITGATRLYEQHTLRRLDFNGNIMGEAELRVLADLLEGAAQSRRIDDLDLSNTFPVDAAADDTSVCDYAASFKRVVVALLTAKRNKPTTARVDVGVAISLAHNTMVDGVHLHALHDALATATRPLRFLSLAYTTHASSSTPKIKSLSHRWFARICMASPVSSFTNDCALDITLADESVVPHDMDLFHEQLTEVIVPQMQHGLAIRETIRCRVRKTHMFVAPDADSQIYDHGPLPREKLLDVLEVRDDGWCLLVRPVEETVVTSDDGDEMEEENLDAEHEEREQTEHEVEVPLDHPVNAEDEQQQSIRTIWIPATFICGICSDSDSLDIMRMRFKAIICHGDNDQISRLDGPESGFLEDLLVSTGAEIQRLALRRWHDQVTILPRILYLCPSLRELDVQSCRLTYSDRSSLWELLEGTQFTTLEAVNVSGTDINLAFFDALLEVAERIHTRYLSMLDCTLDADQLARLTGVLQCNKTLELLELDTIPDQSGETTTTLPQESELAGHRAIAVLARGITLDHDRELLGSSPLSIDQSHAFASVVATRPQFNGSDADTMALAQCLDYAGNVTMRRVVWCDHVPLRRWFRVRRPSV